MDTIIKNGTIITPVSSYVADIGIEAGKIAEIGMHLSGAEESIDASGMLILPGAIDTHTHLHMPLKTTFSTDSYKDGMIAAALGGTTTIFDYPLQEKGKSVIPMLKDKIDEIGKEACVDFALHCGVTDLMNDKFFEEMQYVIDEMGVSSFKCFSVYKERGLMLNDSEFVRLLLKAKEYGGIVNLHAENDDLIDMKIKQYLSEGKTDAWYHYKSRCEFIEAEADKRAVHWAEHLDAPLYLVHMADKEGLEACIKAKLKGCDIYIETCPQYLEYNCDVYKQTDARNFVCSPPMKNEESRMALNMALQNGLIDTIATDHCPFTTEEKDWGKENFTQIPNGVDGIQTMYPYMLSKATKGELTYNEVVRMCAYQPAKIFSCDNKGSIEVGKDADIVIYNPNKETTISLSGLHTECDHTIWEGKKIYGYPVQTFLRGQLICSNGAYVGTPGEGIYIKRSRHKRRG